MIDARRVVFRIQFELRLWRHVLKFWRSYLMPLSLLFVGLVYWASPIDLITDPRPYIGHLDEFAFFLIGLITSRLAVGSATLASAHTKLPTSRGGLPLPSVPTVSAIAALFKERSAEHINLGQLVLNPQLVGHFGPERTIIISGIARGGTSMAAQVVREAGIQLGDTADPVVHEDIEVAEAVTHLRRAQLRGLIGRRNRQHAIWGFKLPNLHERLTPWDMALFRNPHIILMVRDPVAVAQRNVVSMYGDPRTKVSEAFRDLDRLWQFARRLSVPVLLLSYEKAVARPDVAVAMIADFCGVDASDSSLLSPDLIRPENEPYRRATALAGPPPIPVRIRRRVAEYVFRSLR